MRSHLLGVWLVTGTVVLGGAGASQAHDSATPPSHAASQDAPATNAPAIRYSPGVADVLKLVEAKVSAEVIKTFIKNSPIAYNPSAAEIIALKDRGVGPEILTAMLQRGAEIRAQATRAGLPATSAAAPQVSTTPTYTYSTQPVYPDYVYPYPPDWYASPWWYDYGYAGPPFWPSFYFGGGPHFSRGGAPFGPGPRSGFSAGQGGGFHPGGGAGRSAPSAGGGGGGGGGHGPGRGR